MNKSTEDMNKATDKERELMAQIKELKKEFKNMEGNRDLFYDMCLQLQQEFSDKNSGALEHEIANRELKREISELKETIANLKKEKEQSKTKIQTSSNNKSQSQLKDDASRKKEIQKEIFLLNEQISNANITLGALSSLDEEANKIISNLKQSKQDSSNDIRITKDLSSIEKDLSMTSNGRHLYKKLTKMKDGGNSDDYIKLIKQYVDDDGATFNMNSILMFIEHDRDALRNSLCEKQMLSNLNIHNNNNEMLKIYQKTVENVLRTHVLDRLIENDVNKLTECNKDSIMLNIAYRNCINLCKIICSKAKISVSPSEIPNIISNNVISDTKELVADYLRLRASKVLTSYYKKISKYTNEPVIFN